jgi:hypothetical protein
VTANLSNDRIHRYHLILWNQVNSMENCP